MLNATSDLTVNDFTMSLTGFERMAVTSKFGERIDGLMESDPMQAIAALVFLHRRRLGDTDKDAYLFAMGLTLGALTGYFAEEEEEVDQAEPVTLQGKDD